MNTQEKKDKIKSLTIKLLEHIKTATEIICTLAQEKYIEDAESFYNAISESAKSIRKEIDINKGLV